LTVRSLVWGLVVATALVGCLGSIE